MNPKPNLEHWKPMTWRDVDQNYHEALIWYKWIMFLLYTITKQLSTSYKDITLKPKFVGALLPFYRTIL